jgi:hypothetical protein
MIRVMFFRYGGAMREHEPLHHTGCNTKDDTY